MVKRAVAVLGCLFAVCSITECQTPTVLGPEARDQIVQQALKGYYSLRAHGFQELHCQVSMDWDSMYAGLETDADGRELLPILKKVQYQVVVGPTGASNVSHLSDSALSGDEMATRFRQSIDGFDQVLTGFFRTWAQFAIEPLLPKVGSDYEMEDLGARYRMTQGDPSGKVTLEMNHDLVLDHMGISTEKVNGSVDPIYTPSKNGLMLTGYKADLETNGETQHLVVEITNQAVDGFQVPQVVSARVRTPTGIITIPLTFANCHAKAR